VDDIDQLLDPGSASFWNLLLAAAVVIASFFVARYVRRWLRKKLTAYDGLDKNASSIVSRLAGWSVVLVGLILALSILGIDMVPVTVILLLIAGFLFLSVRSLIENWGAGLVLQARGPYRIGDRIESNGFVGYVEQTNLRSVVIRAGNGRIVHIPNADVLKNPLVNRMGHEGRRRSAIEFKVAYDTDLPNSMPMLTQAASSVDGVEAEPAPTAWIVSLDDSAVVLELRFWHDHAQRHRVRSDVAEESLKRLSAAGVSMPFPTQEVLLSGSLDLPGNPGNKNPTDE
jgi:small conductance mechanosensitive channel